MRLKHLNSFDQLIKAAAVLCTNHQHIEGPCHMNIFKGLTLTLIAEVYAWKLLVNKSLFIHKSLQETGERPSLCYFIL